MPEQLWKKEKADILLNVLTSFVQVNRAYRTGPIEALTVDTYSSKELSMMYERHVPKNRNLW